MKCFICLWDMTTDPDAFDKLLDRNYPHDAVTSHNGTALCIEHINRVSTVDICGPRKRTTT